MTPAVEGGVALARYATRLARTHVAIENNIFAPVVRDSLVQWTDSERIA
jgi:hypothetical protein